MVLQLFVNFCILFTFAFFLYWFAENNRFLTFPFIRKFRSVLVGIMAGLFGVVLMLESIHVGSSIIIDGRMAVLALSGLFGGPVAPVIAGVIMGTGRILINDITTSAMIAGINTMVIGSVIGLVAVRIPITFQNAWKYFAYTTLQTVLVIGYLSLNGEFIVGRGAVFILYSILSFILVYYTLFKLDYLSKEVTQIEQLAVTDYLTTLPNTRKFQEIFSHWQQTKSPFYLAVADIDYFKRVNDQYGHPVGDVVLKQLAEHLSVEVKKAGGVVARIGGEEFAMLLPGESEEKVQKQLDTVRLAIASRDFSISNDLVLPITISIGAAGFPRHKETLTELYKAADDELYLAKQSGRNCVRVLNGRSPFPVSP